VLIFAARLSGLDLPADFRFPVLRIGMFGGMVQVRLPGRSGLGHRGPELSKVFLLAQQRGAPMVPGIPARRRRRRTTRTGSAASSCLEVEYAIDSLGLFPSYEGDTGRRRGQSQSRNPHAGDQPGFPGIPGALAGFAASFSPGLALLG